MRYKIISCKVFEKELKYLMQKSKNEFDIDFCELGEHARPAMLRYKLQELINQVDTSKYDAILLGYGLCGRAVDELEGVDIPIVIPRSHDCCGILLGSRKRFEELFKEMPSTPFSSVGYIDNGEYFFSGETLELGDSYANLVEKYGEDDAQYIWEAMHPKLDGARVPIYFISHKEIDADYAIKKCREKALEEGREFRQYDGSLSLLERMLSGDYHNDDFLILNRGEKVKQVGDWDRIITIIPSDS